MQRDTEDGVLCVENWKNTVATIGESQAHPSYVTLLEGGRTSNCISWIQESKNSITILEDAPHFEYTGLDTALSLGMQSSVILGSFTEILFFHARI